MHDVVLVQECDSHGTLRSHSRTHQGGEGATRLAVEHVKEGAVVHVLHNDRQRGLPAELVREAVYLHDEVILVLAKLNF